MRTVNIYTCTERVAIELTEEQLEATVEQLRKYVLNRLRYSSHAHLYREPLSTFSRLDFVLPTAPLRAVLSEFGSVCLTLGNSQCAEEAGFLEEMEKSANDLTVTAQTCWDGVFWHSRYRIDSKTPVSFARAVADRMPGQVHAQYYQLRLPFREFTNQELISDTLARLAYSNRSLLLTADQHAAEQLTPLTNHALLNFRDFYLILVEGRSVVMSRQADWKVVAYLLSVILKATFKVEGYESVPHSEFQVGKDTERVVLVRSAASTALVPPLTVSFFVGQTSSYLVFLQQSSVLHVYSRHPPYALVSSAVLCCDSSPYLDEEIPILLGDELVMYSITVSCIILKHYSLPLGELRFARHHKWEKEFGGVKADSLDLLAASIGLKIRAFYVHDPMNYLEIQEPDHTWLIFVAKLGQNVLSDGSGLFGLGVMMSPEFDLYSLPLKQKIASFSLPFNGGTIRHVSFNMQARRFLITQDSTASEFDFTGELKAVHVKPSSTPKYSYAPTGEIFASSQTTFRWLTSQELRVKSGVLLLGECVLSFNSGLQAGDFSSIFWLENGQGRSLK